MSIQSGGKGNFGNFISGETSSKAKPFNIKQQYIIDFELEEEIYNIILCTEYLKCTLWKGKDGSIKQPFLSPLGIIVTDAIYEVPRRFRNCKVEKYCVMPNHVHVIVSLIKEFDSTETKHYVNNIPIFIKVQSEMHAGIRIWNDDHKCSKIKNRAEYDSIFNHTARNMLNWESDCYFRI